MVDAFRVFPQSQSYIIESEEVAYQFIDLNAVFLKITYFILIELSIPLLKAYNFVRYFLNFKHIKH